MIDPFGKAVADGNRTEQQGQTGVPEALIGSGDGAIGTGEGKQRGEQQRTAPHFGAREEREKL
jgi:hypothetical protein